jgi:uncharacterized protein (TIGR03437 family)
LKTAALLLSLAGALCAQRIELLIPELGGRAARDPAGRWIVAQGVSQPGLTDRNIRVRSLAEDPPGFDITLGGSGNDALSAIRILPDGDILLLGTSDSPDFPASPSALWTSPAAPQNPSSFLVRLDPQGKIRSSTYIAASDLAIQARALAIGPDGSLIIGAEVRGTAPAKFGDAVIPGTGTLLVLKVDAKLTRVSAGIRLGESNPCNATLAGLQIDDRGNIVIAGSTCGDDFPTTPNAYLTRRPGGTCFGTGFFSPPFPCPSGVIARLDGSDLHVTAATYLGGTAAAFIRDLALDRNGSPYVTGTAEIFPATNGEATEDRFPTTRGAYQEKVAVRSSVVRPEAVFVTKLTPDLGALAYSTFLVGSRSENPSSILVDGAGRALVAGGTASPDFPATGAFRTPCGPDVGLNPPQAGFVSRLDAEGRTLTSSARLPSGFAQLSFLDREHYAVASTGDFLTEIDLDSGDAPSVACVVNGANFRPESFVAPNQLLTFIGANFPAGTAVLFQGVPAPLLYSSPTQINAVVPAELAGRSQTVVALVSGGVTSNIRAFSVRNLNPTVKVFVTGDGKLVDRGNPLADIRLSDGSSNSIENPAQHGEALEIYTTGVDLRAPLEVTLGSDKAELLETSILPGTFGSVQALKVRVPDPCCGGVRVITITNGGQHTDINPGFVWVQ